LLAEEQDIPLEERKRLFEEGVKAGERALGPKFFQENEGNFWLIIETRPYMRAKEGLAKTLWDLGKIQEAITHFEELLRLNPNDNQSVRYSLIVALLEEKLDDKVADLLARYPEDKSAYWIYSEALWAFRKYGPGSSADAILREALKSNPYVPLFMFGILELPDEFPEYMGFGDPTEAIYYVLDAFKCWIDTPNALKWMSTLHIIENLASLF